MRGTVKLTDEVRTGPLKNGRLLSSQKIGEAETLNAGTLNNGGWGRTVCTDPWPLPESLIVPACDDTDYFMPNPHE